MFYFRFTIFLIVEKYIIAYSQSTTNTGQLVLRVASLPKLSITFYLGRTAARTKICRCSTTTRTTKCRARTNTTRTTGSKRGSDAS